MRERTVTINGMSKTYSVTGWRVGWAVAAAPITAAIRKVHDFLTVGAPHPLQEAGAAALRLPESFYAELAAMYERKRGILFKALTGAGLKCAEPQGAYYIIADIGHLGFNDDFAAADFFLDQVGVAPVPGSSFYRHQELGRRKLRFTFSKSDETLAQAAERLATLEQKLRGRRSAGAQP
jgi:aminotransferase